MSTPSRTPRKVSVAILSWNGRRHLEECLPALEQQEPPGCPWEVLVLDNGSSDDTAEWTRRHHPEVRLITSPVNLGFCAGNNRLVEEAEGDAVVFLNNDTRPHPGWLGALVDTLAAAPDDVAAVSGKIVDWEGARLDFARGAVTFDGHAFQLGFGEPLSAVEVPPAGAELPFACGGNMIVKKASYLAAGGFDDDYFAYLEDVDLGWRLWSGGERVIFAPEAVVHHRSMASSELLGLHHRGFLFERNAFLTAYKNLDTEHRGKLMPAILLTLHHRTQTLLVQNNLGGEQLTVDPYAGHIANTASPGPVTQQQAAAPAAMPRQSLAAKWRSYGTRELLRRGARKAVRLLLPPSFLEDHPGIPRINDGRTVSQLRALTYLCGHLDQAAAKQRRVAARRRRCDREIFERFPLYLVPTYPGDERFFASEGFRAWLPKDVPLVESRLEDVMRV